MRQPSAVAPLPAHPALPRPPRSGAAHRAPRLQCPVRANRLLQCCRQRQPYLLQHSAQEPCAGPRRPRAGWLLHQCRRRRRRRLRPQRPAGQPAQELRAGRRCRAAGRQPRRRRGRRQRPRRPAAQRRRAPRSGCRRSPAGRRRPRPAARRRRLPPSLWRRVLPRGALRMRAALAGTRGCLRRCQEQGRARARDPGRGRPGAPRAPAGAVTRPAGRRPPAQRAGAGWAR